jgi:hypothetical protein
MSSLSVENYKKSLKYLGKRGALLGINILAPGYKAISAFSIFTTLDLITSTMVAIYCVHEFMGDLEKLTFLQVTFGFAFQVSECGLRLLLCLPLLLSCVFISSLPGCFKALHILD